ncbi:MAG TPA: glycosyltransferase [Pyrinomonadaceae bacterium]
MKIGIYNEPSGTGIGGSESVAALLAEALAVGHDVELVHHIEGLVPRVLADAFGANLDGVRLRYVKPDYDPTPYFRNPLRRYKVARGWFAELSEPYDLFIAIVHATPPFCHAGRGALYVLFPFDAAPHVSPPAEVLLKPMLRRRLEDIYQRWAWGRRMAGYPAKAAISDFSREWARRRWDVDCEVIYPPVDCRFERVEKSDIILSVGRFALPGEGHTKRQPEMLKCFREMGAARGWEYYCVGGLRDSAEHRAFFEGLRAATVGTRSHVVANIAREELRSLYERASIFWHAAGYGEDEESRPEMAEHFGISTVEAMAAGCVPVVINKGGQAEIVEHGVSGFLWNTPEELKDYTALLINDAALRARMSEAARARARLYSRKSFLERFMNMLEPLLS